MENEVNQAICKIRPVLGGTNVELIEIDKGVVKVRIIPSTCHQMVSKKMVIELLEEELEEKSKCFAKVVSV